MTDNLEKFILANRDEFDKSVPGLKVWAEIDKKLHPPKRRLIIAWHPFKVAASILLLVTAGMFTGVFIGKKSADRGVNLASVSPEYAEIEAYYNRKLASMSSQVSVSAMDPSLQEDLQNLDALMLELRAELKKAPQSSREQIIRAMITTYQSKLKVLERLLQYSGQQPSSNSINHPHETVL